MLTRKGKCGLEALVHLVRSEPGKAVQVAKIASRENNSKKLLDAIIRDLKAAGFVRGRGQVAALP